jgi:hypothetical protein
MKILLLFVLYAIALSASLGRAGFRSRVKASPRISQERRKRLLIVGATGGTGRQLVAQALERGYTVTALVRNPAKLKLEHSQLTVIQGNVLDYDSASRNGCVLKKGKCNAKKIDRNRLKLTAGSQLLLD